MQTQKNLHAYIQLAMIASILLLLVLGLFQSIWIYGGSETGIMTQVGLQRTRVQALAKDVQILSYRPASEHAQAINELQNVLPRFEQTQAGLQHGDDALQLPTHVPTDVAQLLIATQSDYTAIDTAVRLIIAHHDEPVDPIQRDIVLAHEHDYSTQMTLINTAWQQRIDGAFLHIFWIESGITLAALALIALSYLFLIRRMFALSK